MYNLNESWWKDKVKFFKPEEFAATKQLAFDHINSELVLKLNVLRLYIGAPIIVHTGYAVDGHSAKSQHYLGNAADLHIEGMTLVAQYLVAERFGWGGMGLYPFWNNPGLHVDVRTAIPAVRWVCNENGNYEPLTETWLEAILKKGG